MALSYTNVTGIQQTWTVDTITEATSTNVIYPIYGGNTGGLGYQYQTYIYPQPYQYQTIDIGNQVAALENKQRELAYLERQIDAKLEELRSLDREGLLKEMLIITEQQLDSLRSAPRYEAPKSVVVDKQQMELPLELVEELAF